MKQVVLASANAGKLRELNALLAPLGMDIVPQSAFDIPGVEDPERVKGILNVEP